MTSVTYHNGPLLTRIETISVYLDVSFADMSSRSFLPRNLSLAHWAGPQADHNLENLVPRLETFLQVLTSSAYMHALGEYSINRYTIGTGRHTGPYFLSTGPLSYDSDAASHGLIQLSVDDMTVRQVLTRALDRGDLPMPTANTCFMIFMPPGAVFAEFPDAGGYHRAFFWTGPEGSTTVYYALVKFMTSDALYYTPGEGLPTSQPSPYQFDLFTTDISHEIAEAVTNPLAFTATSNGWHTDPPMEQKEIADKCQDTSIRAPLVLGDYKLSTFWSNNQGSCFNGWLVKIVPADPPGYEDCFGQYVLEQQSYHVRAEVSNLATPSLPEEFTYQWTATILRSLRPGPHTAPPTPHSDFEFTLPAAPHSIVVEVTVTFQGETVVSGSRTFTPISADEANHRQAICEVEQELRERIIRRWPPIPPGPPPLPFLDPVPFVEQEVQELHQMSTRLAQATGALMEFYQARPEGVGAEKEGA
jgi:hypothetical protein